MLSHCFILLPATGAFIIRGCYRCIITHWAPVGLQTQPLSILPALIVKRQKQNMFQCEKPLCLHDLASICQNPNFTVDCEQHLWPEKRSFPWLLQVLKRQTQMRRRECCNHERRYDLFRFHNFVINLVSLPVILPPPLPCAQDPMGSIPHSPPLAWFELADPVNVALHLILQQLDRLQTCART